MNRYSYLGTGVIALAAAAGPAAAQAPFAGEVPPGVAAVDFTAAYIRDFDAPRPGIPLR